MATFTRHDPREVAAKRSARYFAMRDISEDTLWRNLEAAGARMGWRSRADVPDWARRYMFRKERALFMTDPHRFAFMHGRDFRRGNVGA